MAGLDQALQALLQPLEERINQLQKQLEQGHARAIEEDPAFDIGKAAAYLGYKDKESVRALMSLPLSDQRRLHYNPGLSPKGDRIPLSELKDWQKRTGTRNQMENGKLKIARKQPVQPIDNPKQTTGGARMILRRQQ